MSSKTAVPATVNQGQRMLISADDYQRMVAAGIFVDKPRMELINGEILTMRPLSQEHNSHVDKAAEFFITQLFGKAKVRTQGSVRLDDYSEPEPDLAVLKFREDFYHAEAATAGDVLLIIEVAIKSLDKDRGLKLAKYAESGIPEYWIVLPEQGAVEVYRKPQQGVYEEKTTYRKDGTWTFQAFDLTLQGSDLLI